MSKSEVNEKVKPLVLTDNDTGDKYVLEFSRESVKFAEQRGFDLSDVAKYPLTKVPELFYFAFRMNHRSISRERTDRILFDDLGGLPPAALERLYALYSAPYESLITSEDSEKPKNARVTVEF